MALYRSNYTNVHFVVCSDDTKWCDKNLGQLANVSVIYDNSVYEDMALLVRCNHSIISQGSYGWWAAYLAGGKVVYCKTYLDPKTKTFNKQMGRIIQPSDVFPPEWIGLDP
jgi:galactoside 2-L-fucosyltransferase 1/2